MNHAYIASLEQVPDFETIQSLTVQGVEVPMPRSGARASSPLNWQRRVIDDVIPDSPVGDAPEKTPFRIIYSLTDAMGAHTKLGDALSGDFAPLKPLFTVETTGRLEIPVAFHVLPAHAAERAVNCRSFTERSFLLLMRDEEGRLNRPLAERFLARFCLSPDRLDLAQQQVLTLLDPTWTPGRHGFDLSKHEGLLLPFVPKACTLLQRDLETLLDADLPPSDFFELLNQLFCLHFGLYQPRLASHLNPAMDALLAALVSPEGVDVEAVRALEAGEVDGHRFEGSLEMRAPATHEDGSVRERDPARLSFRGLQESLGHLHFNLLLLHRVRELTRAYLLFHGYEEETVTQLVRYPSQMIERMQQHEDFHAYLRSASEALAVRFVYNQLDDKVMAARIERIFDTSETGLHALRDLYRLYSHQGGTKKNNRAEAQGIAVSRALLSRGEYGLIQSRQRVGGYFELGVGLLPLLLLMVIGTQREKIPVEHFWDGLRAYGLSFSRDEQESLLRRLKSMGLYERFSDAGEASYVRTLMMIQGSEESSR